MTTRFRTHSTATVALVLGLSLSVAGCGKYSWSSLKAQKAWKEANAAYSAQDWKEAAEKYEYVLQQDPTRTEAHFYLANSYDNRYKPSRAGEPENDALMQNAVEHYTLASEKAADPQMKKLALQYLVAAYGPDKLNEPSKAEPLVLKMIEMEPSEPTNYFALMNVYEKAGRYEDAEAALLKAVDVRGDDAVVHTTLAAFYNRQGQFEKTMEAMQTAADLEPNNPTGYHLIGTYYQDVLQRDTRLTDAQKREYAMKGIEAENKAIELNPNFAEALIYKNILLRHLARVTPDRARQAAMLKEAEELLQKGSALLKKAEGEKPAEK